MGFFNLDPSSMTDEELNQKVRQYRRIVFGGMALGVIAFLMVREQSYFNAGIRQAFLAYIILLFPFTIPLNRLHREYFARKRGER